MTRALPEKLTGPQLVEKFSAMEPQGSLPYAKALATCPYPEQPATWSILIHINRAHASPPHFFKTHFNIILPSTLRSSKLSTTQYKKLQIKRNLKP